MIGGRGCVEALPDNEYLVTVAWQGLTPVSAPPASVTCGQNLYDGPAGSPCQADRCRRVVTTVVRIATLN
jgi:type IV pilus assembly protein PilV